MHYAILSSDLHIISQDVASGKAQLRFVTRDLRHLTCVGDSLALSECVELRFMKDVCRYPCKGHSNDFEP